MFRWWNNIYTNLSSSDSGVLTAEDLCNDVNKVIEIDYNYFNGDGITVVQVDESSNIYISLSAMNHPNHGGYGGEIRKCDSNLNLRGLNLIRHTSEKIIYRNGYLIVSGNSVGNVIIL